MLRSQLPPQRDERERRGRGDHAVAADPQQVSIRVGIAISHHWNTGFSRGHAGGVQMRNSLPIPPDSARQTTRSSRNTAALAAAGFGWNMLGGVRLGSFRKG